ncbi:MAG: L-histidine N(alpha)-methyltransferase [Gemmatimonadota bacterium]
MLSDVREGLTAQPRHLPSKYFYDERGSQLFDEITRLPEYYPTRAERALLQDRAATIVSITHPATLIELGAGSSEKTRLLLDQILKSRPSDVTYIPVDVSADFLTASVAQLRDEYPSLTTSPVVADFSAQFALSTHPLPALHAFLGSTIGNFTPAAAVELVTSVRKRMAIGDFFLLGIDLRKDPIQVERAYNDSRGVTAEFNRNILNVINNTLGANFDTSMFDHNAVYDTDKHRIEMRLRSRIQQTVSIPEVGDIVFAAGDAILTELSYKYDRGIVTDLLFASGLQLREWFTDDAESFALALASR